ncbi:MAG: hypothetical protein GY913_21180 [Proteobacteria bacterium]|nr:hypothetical protein [Pseudomonadota bacterium]MCP4919421.1 hypothetical protein [Pseudomonadota bacterium]
MKKLEQLLVRGRALARTARSGLPGAARDHRPVRLVLRLNDIGLAPGLIRATGEPLALGQWQDAIVRFEQWLGSIRVTIAGGEPANSEQLELLVRFANRLECPTHLVTAGPIEPAAAMALVDIGLGAVTVLVGGVDAATHEAAVGGSLEDATRTVEAFRVARASRSRQMDILVGVPLTETTVASVGAVAGWARQAGADGVLATVPLGLDAPAGAQAALESLGRDNLTPEHLATWLEGRRTRPHGGVRCEILSDGTVLVSSHVAPLGNVRDLGPKELWEAADEQIAAARAHPRPWDEVELVPERLASTR